MSVLQDTRITVRSMRIIDLLASRVEQIEKELKQGVRKPYKKVVNVSWGDPQKGGVKPLTFVRQVLAACLYPPLINGDKLPVDVRQRAQKLLSVCVGGSLGSYTAAGGIPLIKCKIAEFISRRDGGVPSYPENIYITSGSMWSLLNIVSLLVDRQSSPKMGVLASVPSFSTALIGMSQLGADIVPYYLKEEHGWELQIEELHRALESVKGVCKPVALYVINPGNPTGNVQSRKSVEGVIRFASEKRLFILADEVYQECVHEEGTKFVSYKQVLAEMGPPFSDTVELASFHSASKGIMGECGLRGGYVELVNQEASVKNYTYNLFSKDSCASVPGQIAMDLMVDPPQPGDPSYPLCNEESQHIKATLVQNVKRIHEVLNSLPGMSCQPVQGGAFAFPRLHLPPAAIQKAEEEGLHPDYFYCVRMLEEVGLCASPGCEFGQEGTNHIRICIMTSVDTMEEVLRRISSFHTKFMKEYY
ncbi:alanine aminotransferase 2 [Genypterus blacodes]|uniref:alanine aminotransferase 2 n=1 Tax=Genypterus blacodes TaxID=154954 RepID=UPI003F757A69